MASTAAGDEFDSWLIEKLRALNTDETVFSSYIKGILEGDETDEEKNDSLGEILSEITVSCHHFCLHAKMCARSKPRFHQFGLLNLNFLSQIQPWPSVNPSFIRGCTLWLLFHPYGVPRNDSLLAT
jgi:hypothetical protein